MLLSHYPGHPEMPLRAAMRLLANQHCRIAPDAQVYPVTDTEWALPIHGRAIHNYDVGATVTIVVDHSVLALWA
jgi:hypothetical protein